MSSERDLFWGMFNNVGKMETEDSAYHDPFPGYIFQGYFRRSRHSERMYRE